MAEKIMPVKGEREKQVRWYLRPVGVIVLLFFVLGPFGLPILFKSPRFSRRWKIILTLLVVAYTGYMIYASLEIVFMMSGGVG